jgi:hypothetical protein
MADAGAEPRRPPARMMKLPSDGGLIPVMPGVIDSMRGGDIR